MLGYNRTVGIQSVLVDEAPTVTLGVGNSLSLTCRAETLDALQADPIYTWALPDGSSETGQTLSLSEVGYDKNGIFTCSADNDFSEPKSANVSVNVVGPLLVRVDPEDPVGKVNHSLSITCSTNNSGVSFVWKNGSKEIDFDHNENVISALSSDGLSSVLTIHVSVFTVSIYSCEVHSAIHVTASKSFSVVLSKEIYLLWDIDSFVGLIDTDSFTLICPVTGGQGELSTTWYRNNTPVPSNDRSGSVYSSSMDETMMYISSLSLIHEYDNYVCVTIDESGMRFSKVYKVTVESESQLLS